MTLTTFHTGIQRIAFLTQQPREIAAVHRELLEARQDPTQQLVGVVTLGNHCDLRGVGTQITVLGRHTTRQHITVDDTYALRGVITVAQECGELLTHQHIDIGGVFDLTTAEGHRATQIDLSGIEETTDEEHDRRITDGPHHLTLIHRVEMVHLNTYVTGRTRTVEHVHVDILHALQGRAHAHAEIGLGNLREGSQTCLEVRLLTLYLIFKTGSKRFVAQRRYKNCLRLDTGVG